MTRTRYKPVLQPDGSFCYSGHNCRRHGTFNSEQMGLLNFKTEKLTPASLAKELKTSNVIRDKNLINETKLSTDALRHWFNLSPEERDILIECKQTRAILRNIDTPLGRVSGVISEKTLPELYTQLNQLFKKFPVRQKEAKVYYRISDLPNPALGSLVPNDAHLVAYSDPTDIFKAHPELAYNENVTIQEISTTRWSIPLYQSSLVSDKEELKEEILPADIKLQVVNKFSNGRYKVGNSLKMAHIQQLVEI